MRTAATPEPLSNQSGAEQEFPWYIECLLSVNGDTAFFSTFDKAFWSGCDPQWADRPLNAKSRYPFHALFPAPEEIQHHGFLKAGRLWRAGHWEAGGDLCEMQVRRVLGEWRYRLFVWNMLPENMFRVISRYYPTLKFHLTAFIKDDNSILWDNELTLCECMITNGQYTGSYRWSEIGALAQIREEVGFQP